MSKVYIILFGVCLGISGGLARPKNNNVTTESSKLPFEFAAHFHQSDYKLTYEYAQVIRRNKSFGDYDLQAFKYNRTCAAVNASFHSNINIGYDLELEFQAYKFASNEYRLFPTRFQINFCQSIDEGLMGFGNFFKCGNFTCPILKGQRYHYCNFAPDESMCPPFLPSRKYAMEVRGLYHNMELYCERHYIKISRRFD